MINWTLFVISVINLRHSLKQRWRGFAIGRATDLRFTGRGFESWLGGHHCVVSLGKLYLRLCVYVTKQAVFWYRSVPSPTLVIEYAWEFCFYFFLTTVQHFLMFIHPEIFTSRRRDSLLVRMLYIVLWTFSKQSNLIQITLRGGDNVFLPGMQIRLSTVWSKLVVSVRNSLLKSIVTSPTVQSFKGV